MHLVLPDHFSKRKAQLGGAHGACDCDQHSAALFKMSFVTLRCILQACSVKVPVMVRNEIRYSVHLRKKGRYLTSLSAFEPRNFRSFDGRDGLCAAPYFLLLVGAKTVFPKERSRKRS